ncbi:DUF6087 family protein [Streptomyces sp. NPDC060064]|uniref:DUF6087 family protein n=1 Tax=Streptomyces sp. NPDC060064 TaxID=3347049 RepID=UPI0036D06B39
MDEEPLEEWAHRREERLAQSKGKLRAVPLTSGSHRAQHVEPHAPRVIQEWDGIGWVCRWVSSTIWLRHRPRSIRFGPSGRLPPSGAVRRWGEAGARHRRTAPAEGDR